MNTTTYPRRTRPQMHPAQRARAQAFDTRNDRHPVREEIQKCIGTYELKAVVEEDAQTLNVMRDTPGLISFLCTILKDERVIAQGHGSSVLSPNNKFLQRAVHSAFNSSLADAVIRATKVLNTFHSTESDLMIEEAYRTMRSEENDKATDKQREYLQQLIQMNVEDESEREQLIQQLPELQKQEASQMIESFRK